MSSQVRQKVAFISHLSRQKLIRQRCCPILNTAQCFQCAVIGIWIDTPESAANFAGPIVAIFSVSTKQIDLIFT